MWWPNKLSNQIHDVTSTRLSTETYQQSQTSLRTKSVAHMRWADLGDHHQGIKWIKCFNPPQQERKGKKKSWLTDRKSSPNTKLWSAWRLAEVASSYPEPGSACLESSGESEVDFAISCWRARTPHYIIHMLHNTLAVRHRPTHTHTLTRLTHTQTHMPEAKLGLPRMSLLQMFLLHQFPSLLQPMCMCCIVGIMCLHMIVHFVYIVYLYALCFVQI